VRWDQDGTVTNRTIVGDEIFYDAADRKYQEKRKNELTEKAGKFRKFSHAILDARTQIQ